MKKKIIIACSKEWFIKDKNIQKFLKRKNLFLFKKKKAFNKKRIKKINPEIIFFPHWSYKIDKDITNNYNCICFHAAPLPYGRGGSPIQNLIKRNFKNTPVCAFKMTDKLDAGPIYLKKTISLGGNLDQIFYRIASTILKMMKILIKKNIKPKAQKGKSFVFKRIQEKESQIKNEKSILKIYNKIRMLDSEEYPQAYFKINNFKFYLSNPVLKKNTLTFNAKTKFK